MEDFYILSGGSMLLLWVVFSLGSGGDIHKRGTVAMISNYKKPTRWFRYSIAVCSSTFLDATNTSKNSTQATSVPDDLSHW